MHSVKKSSQIQKRLPKLFPHLSNDSVGNLFPITHVPKDHKVKYDFGD